MSSLDNPVSNLRSDMKTIFEQTGWKRKPMPVSLCQDFDVKCRVTHYDFDLYNKKFERYCEKRGTLCSVGEGGTIDPVKPGESDFHFRFTADHSKTKADYFKEFGVSFEEPFNQFSDEELEIGWKIMLSAKGAMQDCWELFLNEEDINK